MRRKIGSILLMIIFCISVIGCSNNDKNSENGAKTNSENSGQNAETNKLKNVTLTYATWNENQRDSIQATIDGFKKINPQIKVEIQITPWGEYWTKLEAAATSGNMPDIVTMHTNQVEKYIKGSVLAQLDDLNQYDESFSYDNYDQGITKLYTYDNKHYGIPKDKDCVMLVYNKEIFDNAGVSHPTSDWTWNDLEQTAQKLTDKGKKIYGFNAYNNDQEAWGNFLYQNGGGFINEEKNISDLDNPKSIEAMQFFIDLYKNFSPSKEMQAEVDPITLFSSGIIAMEPMGNWQFSYLTDNAAIKDKFAIAPLPAAPDGKRATISNGLALSVPADCKNMEEAKIFLTYAGSEQGMKDAASGPAIPAYNGVDKDWAEKHKDLYNTDVILTSLPHGVQLKGSELKTQWSSPMYEYVGKIFDGSMSVEEAFKKASEEMNKILAEETK